ncbi:MAG: hypothetical protein HRT68_04070 [Flavobacteriaceae bacterium]|nr:hypothetical protein [Flavobacteriaceae bacterium]
MTDRQLKSFGVLIGILFLISTTMECFTMEGRDATGYYGFVALLLGWMNLNYLIIIWFANPLFLISLVMYFTREDLKLSLILSVVSSILAFSFFLIDAEVLINEAGHYKTVDRYLLGYWLWLFSHIWLFIMTLIRLKRQQKTTQS